MSRRVQMPAIAYIVARSHPDNVIGCDNKVPWHIRSDMKRFRSVTETHAVIMGRKTYESIGRPLPNRLNIVLTRSDETDFDNVTWVKNRESALYFADLFSIVNGKTEVFVIGGSEIYDMFSDLFYEIFLTVVMVPDLRHCLSNNFAYFDYEFDPATWKTLVENEIPASEHDDYPTRFLRLKKKKDVQHRYRDLADFLTEDERVARFREKWALWKREIRSEDDLVEQIELALPDSLAG